MSLAARGARKFGEQAEQIQDQAELMQVRRQARRVYVKALLAAILLTLMAYFLPV